MTVLLIPVLLFIAYSAWCLRGWIERWLSFYARFLLGFSGLYFILSHLLPEQSAWIAARIIMFSFACGQYIAYFAIAQYWSFLLLVPFVFLVPAAVCSISGSRKLNFFGNRFILAGSFLSPLGAIAVIIGLIEVALVGVVVLLNSYIISPMFVMVLVVSLSLLFHRLRKIEWKNEIARDVVFLAAPVLLLVYFNLPLFWNPIIVALSLFCLVAFILANFINSRRKPAHIRTWFPKLYRFLIVLFFLMSASGMAGLSPGADGLLPWRSQWTLDEVAGRPGVELLTDPVEHYSCLLSPDEKTLFAALGGGRSVSRIPLDGKKATTRPTDGWSLWTAYITPSNQLAVLNGEAFGNAADLVLFDAQTLEKNRSLKVDQTLHGLHYSKRFNHLYLQTLYGQARLLALNPETLGVVRKRRLPFDMNFLYRMKGDDELDRLYLPDVAYNGTLHVLSMSTLKTIKRVRIGTALTDVAVAPEQDRLYVACPLVSKIVVLRRSDLKMTGEIRAGPRVRAIAVDGRRRRLYAGNSRDGTIDVFDTGSGAKLMALPAAHEIRSIVLDGERAALYFTSERGVFRVDLKKLSGAKHKKSDKIGQSKQEIRMKRGKRS